jgi:hypothetical protein
MNIEHSLLSLMVSKRVECHEQDGETLRAIDLRDATASGDPAMAFVPFDIGRPIARNGPNGSCHRATDSGGSCRPLKLHAETPRAISHGAFSATNRYACRRKLR